MTTRHPTPPALTAPRVFAGLAASPGLVAGNVVQFQGTVLPVVEEFESTQLEQRRLRDALARAKDELASLRVRLEGEADPSKAAIFAAHAELLDDPDLLALTRARVASGRSAAFAWHEAFTAQANRLGALQNELLAGRASDLRDVGLRVLRLLAGHEGTPVHAAYSRNTVLVAAELTPSDIATLDRSRVVGVCTVAGGMTAHVAILARALALPAIVGIDPRALDISDGTAVLLDADAGALLVDPQADEMAHIETRHRRRIEQHQFETEHSSQLAETIDGHRVRVFANAGSLDEAEQAVLVGAEGIGLLRSEFLFRGRETPPSEDEQFSQYTALARVLGPARPLAIRMLDIGGDKSVPFTPIAREANPLLGDRGVRVMLSRPSMLLSQIAAILRAGAAGNVRGLVPMVSTLEEWRAVRALFEMERERLGVSPVPLGVMIEVPSAALLADQFSEEVDFMAIGTNDLAQYALAMDRAHPKLAPQVDALHPAVLQLIRHTIGAAHRQGKEASICGAIAGDEQAIALLVGLGVDVLSVPVSAIPAVKAKIRRLRRTDCEALAQDALRAGTASEVHRLTRADDADEEET